MFILPLRRALLFSVLGGALLTRYLLPMIPLVLLVAVSTLYRRVPYWQGLAVFSAAAFVLGLFINHANFSCQTCADLRLYPWFYLFGINQEPSPFYPHRAVRL